MNSCKLAKIAFSSLCKASCDVQTPYYTVQVQYNIGKRRPPIQGEGGV